MPILTIRHLTSYHYRQPVAFGEHRMMLHPRDSHDQKVIQADLKISPEPTSLRFVQDAFGNYVGIAQFSRRSKELSFESTVCLEHSPCDTTFDLEHAGRAFPVDYSVDDLRDLGQYIERHQLDPMGEVGRWARQFLPPIGSIGTFELLTRLSEDIHHGFLYRRREAKGIQSPVETLRLGHGSCRDFAMLMIDAARSFGLAARFASGYLAVPLDRSAGADGRLSSRVDACLGANLSARRRLDGFRSHQRQRRQHRSCHCCGRARSSPRNPASRHLYRISVRPTRHGGASESYARHSERDPGRPATVHASSSWPNAVIDVERGTTNVGRRHDIS